MNINTADCSLCELPLMTKFTMFDVQYIRRYIPYKIE